MDKLFKALIAFVAITISLASSLPENGNVIEIIKNTSNLNSQYVSSFYRTKNSESKIIDPVIKIDIITDTDGEKIIIGNGTGFAVNYNKKEDITYVLTNMHICKIQKEFFLPLKFFFEISENIISNTSLNLNGELQVVSMDDSKDLCLMSTPGFIRPAIIANNNYDVRQMERVKIIGGPNGVFPIILDTYISNLISRDIIKTNSTSENSRPLYLISEIIFGGQSGSPVYNDNGEVVGVIFMNLNNEYGPIYGAVAIPLEDINEFLKENYIN